MCIRDRCGTVAIIGRPNVGKSTLFNRLIGQHLSPVTYKPQTTRYNIKGILTQESYQIVFVDTPGMHKNHVSPLNRILNRNAKSVLYDVDMIIFMASCRKWTNEDQEIYELIKDREIPRLLLLNKIDLLTDKKELLSHIQIISESHTFDAVIPISALKNDVFKRIENEIVKRLPEQLFLFTNNEMSDREREFIIAELVREKIMKYCQAELPYVTHVQVESLVEKGKMLKAIVNVWVEKRGQRTILIGTGGANLKMIGTAARKQIERVLGVHVYLKLQAKIRKSHADQQALMNTYLN